jgi:hypothetical protein
MKSIFEKRFFLKTETVALCFGYPKTPCLQAEGKLSSKQMNRPYVKQTIYLGFSAFTRFSML